MGDGMKAHTTYKVMAEFSGRVPGTSSDMNLFTVHRRFSDFDWIRAQLRASHPELLVPVLPEKQQLGRFNPDFVELRQRALQRWMDHVVEHEVLGKSPVLQSFLTDSAEILAGKREGTSTKPSAKAGAAAGAVKDAAVSGGSKVFSFIKGAVSSDSKGDDSKPLGASASMSAEDLSFSELENYLLQRATLVNSIYTQAAAAVVHWREQAQLLLEYGAGLRGLAGGEGGPLGTSLSATGLSVWTASTASYEQAVQESELWVELLADEVRSSKAIEELIKERRNASSSLADALSAVEKLKAQITALASAATSTAAKEKADAETELGKAVQRVQECRSRYDTVAASAISEVDRYRLHEEKAWKKMMLDWATIQWRNNHKLSMAWEKILPEVEASMAHEGAMPLAVPAK